MISLSKVLILIVTSASAYTADYGQPAFTANVKDVQSYYSPLKSSLFVSYDQNSGAVFTSFKIPIRHLNLELTNSVQFQYSSFSFINEGYGIGVSLNLPRFYKNPDSLRSNYILELDNQIVEYQVDEKNGYELDLTFFSSLKVNEENFEITFPSGKKILFSKENGNIIKEISSFKNAFIDYVWAKDGKLVQINPYNGSEVKFSYEKCNFVSQKNIDQYSLPVFHKERVLDNTKCLNSISIAEKKILFTYEDGFLKRSFWEESDEFPLFSAEYSSDIKNEEISSKIIGNPGKDTIALKLGNNGIKFIKNSDLLKKFGLQSNSDEISFNTNTSFGFVKELDLNHDGLSDFIVEKIDHIQGVRYQENDIITIGGISVFGDYVYRQSDNSKARTPEFTKKEIFVAFGRLNNEKNDLQFYVDKSVVIPSDFNTISPACLFTFSNADSKPLTSRCNNPGMKHWDEHEDETNYAHDEPSTNYKAVLLRNSSLLVGDFNGDSYVDILHCSKSSKKIIYGKSGGFLTEVSDVDFPCTSQSVAEDINQDGLADIISTEGVFLNFKTHFEKSENTNLEPLLNLLKDQKKIQEFSELSEGALSEVVDSKTRWRLYKDHIDEIKDKKFSYDINTNKYFYDKEERDIQIITNLYPGSGLYLFIGDKAEGVYLSNRLEKRVSKLTNALGAVTEFEYLGKGHLPIINKVSKLNLTQKSEEKISYFAPILSKLNGRFLGYKFSHKEILGNEHQEGHEVITHFFADRSKDDLLKRAPIHGKVAEVVTCKPGQCQNLVSTIKLDNASELNFDEAEFIELNKWSVLFSESLNNKFKKGQYLKVNQYNSNSYKIALAGQNVFKSLINRTKYFNFSVLGPLKTVKEKIVGIQSSSYGTESANSGIYEKTVEIKEIIDEALLLASVAKFDNESEKNPISKVLYSYEGKKDLGNFSVTSSKLVNEAYNESSKVVLDKYARISKNVSVRSQESKISYSSDELRVETVDSLSKNIKEYSAFGDLVLDKTFELSKDAPHTEINYEYALPGLISKVSQNDEILEVKTAKSREDNIILDFNLKKGDILLSKINRSLDHLGNTIYETKEVDGIVSLISKSTYDANSKILNEYQPRFGSVEEVLSTKYSYDFASRLIQKKNILLNQVDSWTFDQYKSHYINSQLISKEEIAPSNLKSHVYRADGKHIAVEDSLARGFEGLYFEDLSLKYEKDFSGSVVNVTSNDLVSLYSMNSNLYSVSVDDMSTFYLNSFGNIEKFEGFIDSFQFSYDNRQRLSSYDSNIFTAKAEYDDLNFLTSNKFTNKNSNKYFSEDFKYNEYNLISNVVLSTNQAKVSLDYIYEAEKLKSISDTISDISYDTLGLVSRIKYANGIQVDYERDPIGQIQSIKVKDKSLAPKSESYERNENNQISKMVSSFNLSGKSSELEYRYTSDLRFVGETNIDAKTLVRDEFFNLNSEDILIHKTNILQFENKIVNYGVGNQIIGFMDNSQNTSTVYLKENLHFIEDSFVKYIEVNGIVVGAYIFTNASAQFYPIVTDVRGSVRLAYNAIGELVLVKNYDAWGVLDLNNSISISKIDEKIVYDFAKLKRENFQSKYLISDHRVYNPYSGQWLSLDPLLLNGVKTLLNNRYYELDGLSYAAGDPVNFIDPGGKFVIPLFVALSEAVTIVGGTTAASTMVAYFAAKSATWLDNTVNHHSSITANIAHNRVDEQFFGENGVWTKIGKNGLNLTPIGDVVDIASFAFGKDFGQLYSPGKGMLPDMDREDAFVGAMLPIMKMRSDFFFKNDFMARGLSESSINFLQNSSRFYETIDTGYDYYQSSWDVFRWEN